MVIDMNEAQVRTVVQVRHVLDGTQELEFRAAEDDEGRYRWIGEVLQRLGYRQLGRSDPEGGAGLPAAPERLQPRPGHALGRALGRRPSSGEAIPRPEPCLVRRYTAADVALLADVDRAIDTLPGPATACVLRRQRDVFGDVWFERLGSISVAHLYNLRGSDGYRQQRVVLTKTSGDRAYTIGVRRAPVLEGLPGFIRIDSVNE